jgi:tryptophan 2,3-dioxygenase
MTTNLNDPVLTGRGATDYERYLRTDELLALQKSPADVTHRDEHLFQTVHQSSELWLKLACIEIDESARLIDQDAVLSAVRLLRRANDAMSLVTDHLHMLEHMSPSDYAVVRTALGHGAGFDSLASGRSTTSLPPSPRPSTLFSAAGPSRCSRCTNGVTTSRICTSSPSS